MTIMVRKDEIDTVDDFKQWLQKNPTKVVYELAEPYYEKISNDNLILDVSSNSTISTETTIPLETIELIPLKL